jgi:hypothetical protein
MEKKKNCKNLLEKSRQMEKINQICQRFPEDVQDLIHV